LIPAYHLIIEAKTGRAGSDEQHNASKASRQGGGRGRGSKVLVENHQKIAGIGGNLSIIFAKYGQ
jgi:hypothetical protein